VHHKPSSKQIKALEIFFSKALKRISITKLKFFLLAFLLMQFQSQFAFSATTYPLGEKNTSELTAVDGIIVNFIDENGSLLVDSAKNLNSVSATTNNFGAIKFTTINNLTVNGAIGETAKSINNISFQNNNGTLTAKDDLFIANGINTTTNNSGNIVLSGTKIQTISSSIGSINYNLNQLSINQNFGADFKKDVYADTFTTSGTDVKISGTGNLNFTDATLTGTTTISNSGNVNIGKTNISAISGKSENLGGATIASGGTLNIDNGTTSFTDLTMTDATSKIIIGNDKSLNISGDIINAGTINAKAIQAGESANTDKGTLTLSGAITQTINASIGESTNRLGTLNVKNIASSEGVYNSTGIVLNNNAYLKNITFSNSSKTAKILINAGKTINLSSNITETNGGSSLITGDGTLILQGNLIQTIDSSLGSSISDRLGALEIKSTSNIVLNDESYIGILTSSANPDSLLPEFNFLTNNSSLNITNLNINKSLKINGSGAFEVASLDIANGKNLTLGDDKTLKITKEIKGLGAIKTNASGSGNIFFSSNGISDIDVANQIGESTARLNKIIVNTPNSAVNLNNDTFISSLDFTNSAGQSKITTADTKTLNISGDIKSSYDSAITGLGTVNLSGSTKEQNIYTKLGTSDNYLKNLTIENPFGATLYADSFVGNLNLVGNVIKISDSILTIDNPTAFNLNNVNFTSNRVDNFGKIKLIGAFEIAQSKIIFDYTNNNSDITWSEKDFVGTKEKYNIIEANSLTNPDSLNLITVSDNSYLFDNVLEIDGTNIVTTIQTSDDFSEKNLGSQDYALLLSVLSSSNLASKFFRISNKTSLETALASLKPISTDVLINNALSVNNLTFDAINSHIKNNFDDKKVDIKKSKNYGLWGQLFGDKSTQKNNDSKQKFNTNNYGGIIGIERLVGGGNNILIGSAIAINKSQIDDNLKIHNSDTSSYQINFYNKNYTKNNKGFYNKNLANFSFSKYNNLRNIKIENYQESVKSNLSGKNYSFESGVGYKLKIIENFSITPDFSLQYFKFSQDSYKEKGSSDLALKIKGINYNEFIAKLGIDFAGNFSHSQIQYKPNFSISWDKKLKNNRQTTQSNFINTAFDPNQTIKNNFIIAQKNIINLGFGLNLSDENNQKLNLKYNLQLANHFVNNAGSLQYSWEF
jgi:outer membrane autotransporter protein